MVFNTFSDKSPPWSITALDQNFSLISLGGGSSLIGFTQSGTGAVARTVQGKERDIVSVKDFGAIGDGVTDDTAAIQAAVNRFGNTASNSAGGLYFPAGTYLVSGTITFNGQTGFSLVGAGKFLTVIQATAGAAGLPLLFFDRGAYCTVKGMSINALSSGPQIGSAIECKMTADAGPTPIGMIFEDLYIDAQQAAGFSSGIRYDCAVGQDNNNEQGFLKNVDFHKCGTGFSIENYNSLWHRVIGGSSIGCGVGISTANGLGGSFSAVGFVCTSNSVADFDIGDNSTHSIDITDCKSEGGTGLWIRCLQTGTLTHGAITGTFVLGETVTQSTSGATGKFVKETSGTMTIGQISGTFDNSHLITGGTSGATTTSTSTITTARQDINVTNSTWHGTINNASVDYRGSGKLKLIGGQIQQTGTTRKISTTHTSSLLMLAGNFFDIDSVEYAGTLVWEGNTYAGGMPTITPTTTSSRLINVDESDYAPVTETNASRTVGVTDSEIIANRAGTITLTLPDPTLWTGRKIRSRTITANTVVSNASNVVPLVGGGAGTAILAGTAGKWADLKSDGTSWQIMAGN